MQMNHAKADVKTKREDRMKRMKRAHHSRGAKLLQA